MLFHAGEHHDRNSRAARCGPLDGLPGGQKSGESEAGAVTETTLVIDPDATNAQIAAEVAASETEASLASGDSLNEFGGDGETLAGGGGGRGGPGRAGGGQVTIEITATNPAGFGEPVRTLVSENADALRLRQHGFEAT